MQKAKVYSVVGSNIEQLGGELERSCKETAAATETEVNTQHTLVNNQADSLGQTVAQDWQGSRSARLAH
jgi:hypothetical protein